MLAPIFLVKHGKKYSAMDVNRLARSIRRHAPKPVTIICFTDDFAGVNEAEVALLPIEPKLVGWWWKVWLFSTGVPFLFLDLDCVVVDDVSPLFRAAPLTILKDPWQPGFNSSVMATDGTLTRVWEDFVRSNAMAEMHGDQDWITRQVPDAALYEPGVCLSYKAEMEGLGLERPPAGCRLVYFHGRPKPEEALRLGQRWIAEEWNA